MTDRELLEFAAKAAGYVPVRMSDDEDGLLLEGIQDVWRPNLDDGDALRLAVKMMILRLHMDLFHHFFEEEIAKDRRPSEATRRAIVLVAAEIGRSMQ